MPGGDRTGPMGMGAMTGRGAGYCAGIGMSGYNNPAFGAGYGRSFGRGRGGRGRGVGYGGRGWRHMYYATGLPGWRRYGAYPSPMQPDPEMEKQALKSQADSLQSELEQIRKRLADMEAKRSEE